MFIRKTYVDLTAPGISSMFAWQKKQAWGMVTPTTIANSFRHCGFIHSSITPGEPDLDEIPLAELMRGVQP